MRPPWLLWHRLSIEQIDGPVIWRDFGWEDTAQAKLKRDTLEGLGLFTLEAPPTRPPGTPTLSPET
jgi:hypothetical protein